MTSVWTGRSFLTKLLGNDNFDISNDILDGIVYFNQFIERLEKFSCYDAVNHLIARGAAGKFKRFQKAYDLFIPIVLTNNEITYMLIQIKKQGHFFKQ